MKNQNKQIKPAKLIADRSNLSRRSAEKAIIDGRVLIDGRMPDVSERFDENCVIILDGKELIKKQKNVYVLFNKPVGYLVTKTDPFGRKTIWDLLPNNFRNDLNSAGRLDKDSEGVIVLTSDGGLIEKITHPKFDVRKKYVVETDKDIDSYTINKLIKGVELKDGMARALFARKLGAKKSELVLNEGRKREVRRMFEALGLKVLKLKRVSIGRLALSDLSEGKWRYIESKEVELIFS